MEIYYEKEDKYENVQLNEKTTIEKILKNKNISLDSVILVKNNQVCLEDETIENEDKLKILSVVSGG